MPTLATTPILGDSMVVYSAWPRLAVLPLTSVNIQRGQLIKQHTLDGSLSPMVIQTGAAIAF